ncbi:hypothetical protein BGX33_003896 [Mortierella sp. NVP41]|nr:hypothetical protein BGX33_003896 [Mortierella sp. NVP41]
METKTHIGPLTLPDIVDSIIPFLDKKRFLARAAVVCRAWNQLYTPNLWRDTHIYQYCNKPIPSFKRQGIHVRQLSLGSLEDSHFNFIVPYCPNVERLNLWRSGVSFDRLNRYLGTYGARLKRFQLEVAEGPDQSSWYPPPSSWLGVLVSTLAAHGQHTGYGGGPALEELVLRFGYYEDQMELSLDTLEGLLEACPSLKKITLNDFQILDFDDPTDNGRTLGSSSTLTKLTLRLMELDDMILARLLDCDLDDQALQHLASTQGDTLLELTLCYSQDVTDSGVMAILSSCRHLTSLFLNGIPAVTMAIMMENGPAERWSCYKSLRRLEIQGLGVVDLSSEIAVDDPRIEENREAFRKMQKWVRMLPNLQELTVNEELIQGFLGIEDQDKEENEGAWASEAIEDADETFGIERSRVGIRGSAVALPAPAVSRTLVGPRLEVLRIWGLKQGGLEASEIDRFVKNYPGLKTAYAYGPGVNLGEMKKRFLDAGIQLSDD